VGNCSLFFVLYPFTRCLRTANSWAENRDVFVDAAIDIRQEFDANKHHKGIPISAKSVKQFSASTLTFVVVVVVVVVSLLNWS
jgi:hypothetical protein